MIELIRLRRRMHYGVGPIVAMAITAMLFLSLSRICLSLWQLDAITDVSLGWILTQGLRVDFASVCGLYALPLLILLIGSMNPYVRVPRIILFIIRVYGTLAFAFLVFNELLTPWFIADYGTRPNHIFVGYLTDFSDLISVLWSAHKLVLFSTFIGTLLSFYLGFKLNSYFMRSYRQGTFKYNILALVLTICIVPLGIRSNFQGKPFSPDMLELSQNSIANALPLNSSYSAVYSMFHLDELLLKNYQSFKTSILCVSADISALAHRRYPSLQPLKIPNFKLTRFPSQIPFQSKLRSLIHTNQRDSY